MNMYCPHCNHAVIFEGAKQECFALRCNCGSYFCAYCFHIAKDSATNHNHVSDCWFNFQRPSIFGSIESWEKAQKNMRVRLFKHFFTVVLKENVEEL